MRFFQIFFIRKISINFIENKNKMKNHQNEKNAFCQSTAEIAVKF